VFILFTALVTAIFSLHKYYSEQRTARLQKIYFEDALLGQVKAIESAMSQTTNNFYTVENLYNFSIKILDREKIDLATKIDYLNTIFDKTINDIKFNITTTDFKKETISKLLYESEEYNNSLPNWIKKFEEDTFRFSSFLSSQVLILKSDIGRIKDQNIEQFKTQLKNILMIYAQDNYVLVQRHYILLHLLSDLVLEFSSENYTNIDSILNAFKKEKIKKITKLINLSYQNLVIAFSNCDITNITPEDSSKIKKLIDSFSLNYLKS
jgi:hypothetical protein